MIGATLFSGIGAPEVAMPHWHWAWHAEIEKFPAAVMAARHPGSVNLGDVSADDFAERAAAIARPDILVFGSPCQSYSVAGKRLGLADPRGNLALVALGIVDRLKPRWFVFENVPGLLSSADGRDFGLFLRTVDEIGYSLCWSVLDAQHFGVAQRRQRVFAVGHLGDWRYPAAVLLEPESLCGNHPPRRQAGQGIAPTISARPTGGGGLGTDFDCDGGLIARALTAHPSRSDGETETFVTHALRADGFDASEDGTGRGTPLVPWSITPSNSNADYNARSDQFAQALTRSGNRPSARGGDLIAFSSKDHGADAGEIAPTPRAMGHTGSHANAGGQVAIAARSTVRRLTPRECERLQGFPDDYTLITYRKKPAADGPRYKSLGNSMARPKVQWILERVERVDLMRETILEAAE